LAVTTIERIGAARSLDFDFVATKFHGPLMSRSSLCYRFSPWAAFFLGGIGGGRNRGAS
jgi:hypothetical protein